MDSKYFNARLSVYSVLAGLTYTATCIRLEIPTDYIRNQSERQFFATHLFVFCTKFRRNRQAFFDCCIDHFTLTISLFVIKNLSVEYHKSFIALSVSLNCVALNASGKLYCNTISFGVSLSGPILKLRPPKDVAIVLNARCIALLGAASAIRSDTAHLPSPHGFFFRLNSQPPLCPLCEYVVLFREGDRLTRGIYINDRENFSIRLRCLHIYPDDNHFRPFRASLQIVQFYNRDH